LDCASPLALFSRAVKSGGGPPQPARDLSESKTLQRFERSQTSRQPPALRLRRSVPILPTVTRIRAITFDVGGTLIEPWPSVGHVYAEVAARFGINGLTPEDLTHNFRRAWKTQTEFDYTRVSWFEIIRATFADRASQLPPEFFPALYDRFTEADVWLRYEDVLPTLEKLTANGLQLGLISNWDARLRPLLANLNLTRHFTSIVISCEAGATKPDARLFAQAAQELGVAPGEMLHVGDSLPMDVVGAEGFGAIGRQVVRRKPLTDARQIRSLTELGAL